MFLFYALDPVVDRLATRRVPRIVASVVVVLAVLGVTTAVTVTLWPQVEAVVARVPEGVDRLRATLQDIQSGVDGPSTLSRVREAARAIDQVAAESSAEDQPANGAVRVEVAQPWRVSDWLWQGGIGALGLMGQATTVLFLTIFLLNEGDSFKRKLVRQVESLGGKRLTVQVLNDIARQIESFIWVQALTSAGVAVVTGVALWSLGIEQPAVWAVFAGLMNIVPYFGPLIVTAVLSAVGFLQFGSLSAAATVAGVVLAITTIEGALITPHLLSRVASLNHVAIFVSIAFWSWMWGAPGMLLAVPMLMVVKAVCDHIEGLQPIGEFLGE
jgi:predicted PurR-regulated permease PerM